VTLNFSKWMLRFLSWRLLWWFLHTLVSIPHYRTPILWQLWKCWSSQICNIVEYFYCFVKILHNTEAGLSKCNYRYHDNLNHLPIWETYLFFFHREICVCILLDFSICVFENMFGSMTGVSNEFLPLEEFLVGCRALLFTW